MKTTPFTDVHIALGAKMHEFAGFNMPIEYSGIIDEHMTVVNGVGVFDVSHMGEFWVKGPNALAFIQSVTSNDASVLPLGIGIVFPSTAMPSTVMEATPFSTCFGLRTLM